jgi:hypothetical protein
VCWVGVERNEGVIAAAFGAEATVRDETGRREVDLDV